MNRRTLVLSALLFVLLTSHFLSYPVQKVNASSLLYEYYNTGDNYRIDIYSAYWEAQTFTPTTRHIITSVKIKVYRYGSPGIVTVSIRATDGSGHPTGADLTSNTFDGNALTTSSSGEWKEVALTSYLLNAGTKYAIVVRATSGDYFNCIFWRWDDSSPTYAGGNREKSSNSGSSWTTDSEDYMFEEWGNPLFTLSIQARKWDNSTILVGAKVYIQNSTYSGYKTSSSTGWANFTGQYDASVKWWVVWQGTTVNYTTYQALDSNKIRYARCRVTARTFTAYDNEYAQLYSSQTRFYITFPNGSSYYPASNSSSFTLQDLTNGTYTVRISWYASKVLQNSTAWDTQSVFAYKCNVGRITWAFKNYTGSWTLYPVPSNMTLECPNSTRKTLVSYSSVLLQNGTYYVRGISWQGGDIVPSTSPFYSFAGTSNYIWTINCRVYLRSFSSSFKDSVGISLYVNPSAFALAFSNGSTKAGLSPSSSYYLQNDTISWNSITWQNTEVKPDSGTFDPTSGNPTVNCRVYALNEKHLDNLGNALAISVTYTFPNSTGLVKTPVSGWVNMSQVQVGTVTVTSPISISGTERYVSTTSTTISLTSSLTQTRNWSHDYQVTITSLGIGSDTSGTVATLDGDAKTQAQLPYSKWLASGYSLTYSFTSPVSASTGKRYAWSSTSGLSQSLQSNTFTVSSGGTVTGAYVTQYYFTVTDAHDSATGQGWYNAGSSVNSTVSRPVSGGTGVQYETTGWTGTGSLSSGGTSGSSSTGSFTINAYSTCTWNWKTQYQITITSSGIGSDSSGTVATLGGNAKTQAQLPYSQWFDNGSSCSYSFNSPVSTSDSNKRYVWFSTSGLSQTSQSNTFTVSGTGTIVGTYGIQYQVTITSSGISTDSSGTVATLDGQAKTQNQLPYSNWFASGYSLAYSFSSPVSAGSTKQYVWSSTSGLSQSLQSNTFSVSSGGTITGTYGTQWYVTITSSGIGSDSSGTVATLDGQAKTQSQLPYSAWFNNAYSLTYSFSSPVASSSTKQYIWSSTSGLSQSLQSNTFSVTSAGTITGTYNTQYYFTVTSSYGSPTGQGWYTSGTSASSTVTSPISGGTGIRYQTSGWTGTGSLSSGGTYGSTTTGSFTITQASSCTWNWVTEYQTTIGFKDYSGSMILAPSNFTVLLSNGTSIANPAANTWMPAGTTTLSAVTWEGSNVRPQTAPTVTISASQTYYYNLRVYSVSFSSSFRDSVGTSLPVNPSIFSLTFPNSTTKTGLSPTSSYYIQNGTTTWSSITWEATNVVPAATTFDASSGNPTVNCLIYNITSFTWKDHDGSNVLPSNPSAFTVQFCNGTSKNFASAPSSLSFVQTGTHYITAITWQSSSVQPSPNPSLSLTANSSWTVNCAVYAITGFTWKNHDGAETLYTPPTQIKIQYSNSTEKTYSSFSSINWVQKGTHALTYVLWEGTDVHVASTTITMDADKAWTVNCAVYSLGLSFKSNDGSWALSPLPVSCYFACPNGTYVNATSFSFNQVQKGTYMVKQIKWQGSNVVPSPNPSRNLDANYDWAINCRVYKVTPTFRNSGGTALPVQPTQIMLNCPNGTDKTLTAWSGIYLQNGTYTLKWIIWQSSNVVPSPNPTFDPTGGSPNINCRIYQLNLSFIDARDGSSITPTKVIVQFPNSTSITHTSYSYTYVQNGTIDVRTYRQQGAYANLCNHTSTTLLGNLNLNIRCTGTKVELYSVKGLSDQQAQWWTNNGGTVTIGIKVVWVHSGATSTTESHIHASINGGQTWTEVSNSSGGIVTTSYQYQDLLRLFRAKPFWARLGSDIYNYTYDWYPTANNQTIIWTGASWRPLISGFSDNSSGRYWVNNNGAITYTWTVVWTYNNLPATGVVVHLYQNGTDKGTVLSGFTNTTSNRRLLQRLNIASIDHGITKPSDKYFDITWTGLSILRTSYPEYVHLNSTATIRAQLVYSYNNQPISGGVVSLAGATTSTSTADGSGWASFPVHETSPAGPFTVYGVNDATHGITKTTQNATITMKWLGDFNIIVLDANGHALNNAEVEIYNGTETYWKTLYTDATGLVSVEDALCQNYNVTIYWQDVLMGSFAFNLDKASISVTYTCPVYQGYIRVYEPNGVPILGAMVSLIWPDGTVHGTYQTDATGSTPLIPQVPVGSYILQTSYGGTSLPTAIAVNQNFDVRLLIGLLSIPYEDHIRVLAYNTNTEVLSYTYNQTFRSLLVKVECSEEPRFFSVFLTNAFLDQFGITIDDVHTLLDGDLINHTIGAYPGGYLLTVTFPLCSSHDVEVVFLSGTLAATLTDSNMMPLEGALVKVYRDGALIREGHTDSNGQLVLTVLPAGHYTIGTYWLGVLVRNDQLTITGAINYEAACPVYAVTVQVVDVLSDLLSGVSVTVHAPDGTVLTSGFTSQDGNIAFRLPKGDYAVTAAYFGPSNSKTVNFDKNTTVRIQVPMLNINSVLLSLIVATAIGIVLYKTVWVRAKRKYS